ncbi:MAG: peptidylprolyl isomerase [bacterium]
MMHGTGYLRFFFFIFYFVVNSSCNLPEEEQLVVARVGDEHLTLREVVQDVTSRSRVELNAADFREYVLRWINDEVLYQEALGRSVDEDEELRKEFESLKKQLIINSLIERALKNQILITDEEISQYYESNKGEFILSDDVVHAYHILTNTRKEANALRRRLKKGEDFEDLAKAIADSLKTHDWDLGYFSKSDIIPEISKMAFNIPVGSYSLPLKSDFGFHLIKVVDKMKKGEAKNLDHVREEIRFMLEQQRKQENYQRFLLQTKSKFTVTTNFQILDSVNLDSLIQKGEKQIESL